MDGATPGDRCHPRAANAAALVRLLAPGERVFLPGSTAEVPDFMAELVAGSAPPLDITGTFVPGINRIPLGQFSENTIYRSMFVQPSPPGAQADGRLRHIPVSYAGFVANLHRMAFDTCLVHVSPPDDDGWCSFGTAVEFTPMAIQRSRRVFAVINARMPRIPGAAQFALSDAAVVAEADTPLCEYDVGAASREASVIAGLIAGFVEDGSTLQIGLGKVPDALMRLLRDRRGLRLHSGMLSDGVRLLHEAGSLDPDWAHTSCVHVGTSTYYDWLSDRGGFSVRGCDYTHVPGTLAGLSRLVAVNSALSVDLFGQANLEMLNGRTVSGVGGASDFAHAASLAADGVSIVALPSVWGPRKMSRIVPSLDAVSTLPRQDIDVVITEQGVADLRGCSVRERAERLVEIAAPQHHASLRDASRQIMSRL